MKVNLSNLISKWIKNGSSLDRAPKNKTSSLLSAIFRIQHAHLDEKEREKKTVCLGAENELHRII